MFIVKSFGSTSSHNVVSSTPPPLTTLTEPVIRGHFQITFLYEYLLKNQPIRELYVCNVIIEKV